MFMTEPCSICVIVLTYVLVLLCIYFLLVPVLNTALYKYYYLVVSYIHPSH